MKNPDPSVFATAEDAALLIGLSGARELHRKKAALARWGMPPALPYNKRLWMRAALIGWRDGLSRGHSAADSAVANGEAAPHPRRDWAAVVAARMKGA